MRIILIGFMCSGKSSVAKILADRLCAPLLEMDQIILQRSGMSSIPEIFTARGEVFFRELESIVALECARVDPAVVSTGGGIIGNPLNLAALREDNSLVVYLRTRLVTIISRQEQQGQWSARPLLSSKEKASELYDSRLRAYEEAASLTIDTDSSTPEEVAEQILQEVKER